MKKLILFWTAICIMTGAAFSQPGFSSQAHRGKVTQILKAADEGGAFWTAGADGFLIKWENGIGEHFQLTQNEIKKAAISPDGKKIAFYETDGGIYYSVKIFDTAAAKIRQSLVFKVPVLSLDYSKKGSYLVITTNATDGLFIYGSSGGKPLTKIKKTGRIFSWAKISSSEKNILLYSPDGKLSYYSLKNGSLLKEIQTEKNLEDLSLFSKNSCLAGIKNGSIYAVSAENGRTLKTFASVSPLLQGGDDALYYFDGREKLYSLYTVGMTERGLKGPLVFENISMQEEKAFSAACLSEESLIMGSADGKIFTAPLLQGSTQKPLLVSSETYEQIFGTASDGENLYLLTEKSVLKASYKNRAAEIFPAGRGWTKIDFAFGKLILRGQNRRDGIFSLDTDGKNEELLFQPKNRVQKIRAAVYNKKEGFLEIESDSVNFYAFSDKSRTELYAGSGIQDAVLLSDGSSLCVAKTASSKPNSALLLVNLKTGETVPVKIEGDIAYSIDESGGYIFGVRLSQRGNGYVTGVFALGTKALTVKELLDSGKEKSDAFIMADFPRVFTNAGGKQIDVINIKSQHRYPLKALSSLPHSMTECAGRLAVLNEDSSISWYNAEQPLPLATWYVNASGEIIEF